MCWNRKSVEAWARKYVVGYKGIVIRVQGKEEAFTCQILGCDHNALYIDRGDHGKAAVFYQGIGWIKQPTPGLPTDAPPPYTPVSSLRQLAELSSEGNYAFVAMDGRSIVGGWLGVETDHVVVSASELEPPHILPIASLIYIGRHW